MWFSKWKNTMYVWWFAKYNSCNICRVFTEYKIFVCVVCLHKLQDIYIYLLIVCHCDNICRVLTQVKVCVNMLCVCIYIYIYICVCIYGVKFIDIFISRINWDWVEGVIVKCIGFSKHNGGIIYDVLGMGMILTPVLLLLLLLFYWKGPDVILIIVTGYGVMTIAVMVVVL